MGTDKGLIAFGVVLMTTRLQNVVRIINITLSGRTSPVAEFVFLTSGVTSSVGTAPVGLRVGQGEVLP